MGDSKVVLAGGTDNMSQAPYMMRGIRFGTRLGVDMKVRKDYSLSIIFIDHVSFNHSLKPKCVLVFTVGRRFVDFVD